MKDKCILRHVHTDKSDLLCVILEGESYKSKSMGFWVCSLD